VKKKIETIENRWDILYRDYPEVYDRFASAEYKNGNITESINKMFRLKNKIVLDVDSGTGLSTIAIAKYAKFVYGVEPEGAIRKIAIEKAREKGAVNVRFLDGRAENMPLNAASVDMVTAITSVPVYHSRISERGELARKFLQESTRVVKKGGHIVVVTIPPKWYGGELAPVILGKSRKTEDNADEEADMILRRLGFAYKDLFLVSSYKSLKEAVETYGFIFGKKAIDYLVSHKKTSIKWKFRMNYMKV